MDYLKAEELRKEWGNKPCSHPHLEPETHLGYGFVQEKQVIMFVLCVGKILPKKKEIKL